MAEDMALEFGLQHTRGLPCMCPYVHDYLAIPGLEQHMSQLNFDRKTAAGEIDIIYRIQLTSRIT